MKNKQLDTKDLLMNKKEELIWRVIDNVINCCAVTRIDGAKSITREELNPQFAKDKARDERIAGIENEVAGMKGDIAKILAAVTKN